MHQPLLPFGNQRWRDRRALYRPPAETLCPRHYDVEPIAADGPAKAFVKLHHYSGSYPAARFRVGLYYRGELSGIAVFAHPCNDRVLTNVFPGDPLYSVELARFVLLDSVPGNGETWFLARAFECLRALGLRGVLSFSDPVPRLDLAGRLITPGHVGTIYQAHNARYLGRSTPRTLRLLPDGTVLSDRTLQKIRSRERGYEYGIGLLVAHGALAPRPDEDPDTWLREWLGRLCRPLHHPGNHRYAWNLQRRGRRFTLPGLPYPKKGACPVPQGEHR